MAESVLNLAKSLETLFPPKGDDKSRDAVRKGLKSLGFTDTEIEGKFIPAIALRNEMGVGHAKLGVLNMNQLKVIHAYTFQAENAFQFLFKKVMKAIEAGTFDVEPYALNPPNPRVIALIEKLKGHLPAGLLKSSD